MDGASLRAAEPAGLKHGKAKHILGGTGEGDVLQFFVRNVFVCKYPAVYERLKLLRINLQIPERDGRVVIAMTQYTQEKVIRTDAVATGAHSLLAGIRYYAVKLVGNP